MSTLGTLKSEIAQLFTAAVADFTINGVDYLTTSINNAVRKAQMNHDFERTKVLCDLVVNGVAGGLLSALKLHGTATAVELTKIIEIGPYTDDGVSLIPKTWMTYDQYKTRQQANQGSEYDPEFRYPANDRPADTSVQYLVMGETIFAVPTGNASDSFTVGLYGCKLFPDYAPGTGGDALKDIFLEYGHDYLMWEAALWLNHFKKEWVPRTEGNLPPPDKMRNEGWDAFCVWDAYQYNKFPEGGL